MMPCQEVRRRAERFLALELPHAEESRVREHLQGCRECRDHYLNSEPALLFALAPSTAAPSSDDAFVAGVLGGVRERRLDRALRARRQRWMAAAAAVAVAVLGGLGGLTMLRSKPAPVTTVAVHSRPAQIEEPPLIEVEGDGVRLYQVSLPGDPGVQVAFVVDPTLEL